MDNLEWFCSIAGTALSLLITTLTFAIKFFRKLKEKLKTENDIKLSNAIIPLIESAEQFLHYSGAEKKEYVLTKANQFAIENDIDFNIESVSEKIEKLVELSKQVNKRII